MEEMIEKVLEIEEMAQKLVEDAKAQEEHMDEIVEEEAKHLKDRLMGELAKEREEIRAEEEKRAQSEIDEAKAESDKTRAALEERFNKNKDAWADEIFKSVISR